MKKKSIALVHMFDWEGLYVNGELKAEGHLVELTDLAFALKLEMHHHYPDGLPKTRCRKYFDKYKRLPKKLSDTFEEKNNE